ncbi:MAG TPA: hypothetical protein VN764_01550 [Polyangiaceae bacterium]|nr:hypothetical protein [Polyangiaceae bacterium]
MFNSAVLDVVIGTLVVFLLVSTICTAIREGLESWRKTRAAYLEAGIRELLADVEGKGIARAFFNHPLIYSLYSGKYQPGSAKRSALESGGNLPSYISGRSFAMALLDIVARGPTTDAASGSPDLPPITLASLRENVGQLGNPRLQRMLILAIDSAEGDIERVRHNLHTWFDDGMGRVSGWYKRSTQTVIFLTALLVVGFLNINTISIAQYLYENDEARAQLVAAAEQTTRSGQAPTQDAATAQLFDAALPIGWSRGYGAPVVKHWQDPQSPFDFWNDVVGTVGGLMFTVFATMLGAPFWFDVLARVTTIRSTFKPAAPKAQSAPAPELAAASVTAVTTGPVLVARAVEVAATAPPLDDGDPCDHGADAATGEATSDEDLPVARGGVLHS